MDCAKHILTLPQVGLPNPIIYGSRSCCLPFFFFLLVMQIGFFFHESVQSLLDVNFQHPQQTAGKSYNLTVSSGKKQTNRLLFLCLPTANTDIPSFWYWNRQGII